MSAINVSIQKKGFGLPSGNPDSMVVLSYIAIRQIEKIKLSFVNYNSQIPNLKHQGYHEKGPNNIINYIEGELSKPNLTESQNLLLESYLCLCNELKECVKYHFQNELNFEETTKDTPLYYRYMSLDKITLDKKLHIHQEAQRILSALNDLISNPKDFIFGKATSLDAHIFGYVSCLLYPHLSDVSLQELVTTFPNLCEYCDFISKKFFVKANLDLPRPSKNMQTKQDIRMGLVEYNYQKLWNSRFYAAAAVLIGVSFAMMKSGLSN